MFPGQQGATCPAQLWPPRLGMANFWRGRQVRKSAAERGLVLHGIKKIDSQASFLHSRWKTPTWSYQPCHPCSSRISSNSPSSRRLRPKSISAVSHVVPMPSRHRFVTVAGFFALPILFGVCVKGVLFLPLRCLSNPPPPTSPAPLAHKTHHLRTPGSYGTLFFRSSVSASSIIFIIVGWL